MAFAEQHTNKQHNTTISQRNQRNQSHVKPNTSPATNQQQQQKQKQQHHISRPQLSPYLFQQPPLLQLKLQCKYKLTEVSDVTFNELLARQVVSRAIDGGRQTTAANAQAQSQSQSTETSFKLELVGLEERRKSISSLLEASHVSRVPNGNEDNGEELLRRVDERRRWMQDGSGAGNEFVTIARSADNQVTQSKCPASHGELLKALARLPARSDACRLGVSPLSLDDPLLVEQTRERPIAESGDIGETNGGAASNTGGSFELETESDINKRELDEQENVSRGRSRVASSSAQNKASDERNVLNMRQNVVLRGEDGNLVQLDNNNVLKLNCLTLGTLLSSSEEIFGSNIETQFCIDALDRRRALISGRYNQSHNQASSSNEDSSAANQRPYSHRSGSNNNGIGNGNKLKENGLFSYLSLSGLTSSGEATLDNSTTTTATMSLLAKLSNNNGDGQNVDGVTNWPIIVADSSGSGDSSLVGGRRRGVVGIDRDHETQQWQLLAPPLLEWFINNQEVSLMLSCCCCSCC